MTAPDRRVAVRSARARFGLPALTPFARVFHAILNRLRFGAHRDGRVVRVRGRREGRAVVTGFRDDADDGPLFRRLLGSAFDALPPRVRELHDGTETRRWTGSAGVRRGSNLMAWIVATALRFPKAAASVPVSVTFTPERGCERWTRDFGGQVFTSIQSAGSGRDEYLLVERFGIVRVALALVREAERLRLVPRRWSILGLPMPARLLPTGQSFETESEGRFCFDITVAMPFVGLIAAYRGTLEPDPRIESRARP